MGLNIINLAHRLLKNILKIVHEVFKETINFRRELENRKMKTENQKTEIENIMDERISYLLLCNQSSQDLIT